MALLDQPKSCRYPTINYDNDDELFLRNDWPMKGVKPFFEPGPLSKILTIANLWHVASRFLICAKPVFRVCWTKLHCINNDYITTPLHTQLTFTCSNSTIQTLEKGVKYVQS